MLLGSGLPSSVRLAAWLGASPRLYRLTLACRPPAAGRDVSLPFWGSHWPDECTHWCHPGVYQLWLFLLNDLLHQSRLGEPVWVRERY